MARVWMEGFEDWLPNENCLNEIPASVISGFSIPYPNNSKLVSGRNAYSSYGLEIRHGNYAEKTINLSEFYFRAYLYFTNDVASQEIIWFIDSNGNKLIGIYANGSGSFSAKVRVSGTWTTYENFSMTTNTWHKIDIYYKADSSTGTFEVRLNNISVSSRTGLNTGSLNATSLRLGLYYSALVNYIRFDDLALNDTTGSINNSWCGNGTIINLKPKGNGNYSQFDTSQGLILGESGTSTTNIKITGHGLSTNDVIYNVTKNEYRIVTVVDVDNLTVSSVDSQTENDVFIAFTYSSTITTSTGTSTSKTVLIGHILDSYDVTVNTTRNNAIRRVIYVDGTNVYNYYSTYDGILGSTVTSQASGDSIKTFKVKQYAIVDHYKTCNQTLLNPNYANIESTTSNDIDTFDMQELTADKNIPSNAVIVALSHNIYAKEKGAGSQIKPIFRIDSTDYEGNTISLSGGTLQYQSIYNVSPATSSAFTRTEIDGLEAGVKVV